jgi:nucleotide-binding universal stress UspA family protein
MKNEKQLLVAIDFSKCSIKALEFAIGIANNMAGNVLMVHVDKPQSTESVYSKRGSEHQEKIKGLLDKLVKKYQSSLHGNGKLEYKIRKGKVYTEIANQAKYSDAYLLVVGTHGVSGFEEFWIGSNAFKLVTSAPCPVITIRESFIWKQKHIKRIILPIDSSMETRQKVPFATELAKYFDSEIHVLGVYSTNVKDIKNLVEGYAKQAVDYIEEAGAKCEKHFRSCENITEGTIEYAKEVRAELIAVMTEQEKSTKNIWLGPYAQQMVNHSPFPVLTVHSKNIYDVQSRKN